MSGLAELHARLADLDDKLAGCMRCGMCMSVCPAYGQTGLETSVARGKLALLDGLAKEMVKDAEGVRERLGMCLLCGSCQAACPSGVAIMDILLAGRAALAAYLGLPPLKKFLFRLLLPHPRLMAGSMALARRFQGLALKRVPGRPGLARARSPEFLTPPALKGRRVPALPDAPFRGPLPEADAEGAHGPVLLFPGCVVQSMFPQVGRATMAALRERGVGVILPQAQACCGIPALAAGDENTFAKSVAENVRKLKDIQATALVTPCATCASTIRHLWPRAENALPEDLRAPMRELAAKAMDITEYLADEIPAKEGQEEKSTAEPVRVAFHDPCHLLKGLGVQRQPRDLLKAAPGVELVELPHPGACCGCGGSFTLDHPGESRGIGARRSKDVEDSGADIVATACPACMLQLTDVLARDGREVEVRHVIELCAPEEVKAEGRKKN